MISSPKTKLIHIPLNRIRHNPVALRIVDKESIEYIGLVDSIGKKGVLNAINVREIPNPDPSDTEPLYGLVDGLHRFTASQDAGMDTIPAQVIAGDDADVLEAQIIANFHVIKTAPVAFARQLQRIIAGNPALVMAEIASRLGVSPSWVSERLNLPKLIVEIGKLVDDGKIILTNAFALAKLDASLQPGFVERAMTQPPGEFVPAAQAAKKEWDTAKRQGRNPNVDTFVPVVKLQKMAVLAQEINDGKIGAAIIAKHGLHSPSAVWKAALEWTLNKDADSVAAQRVKHESRIADNAKRKADAKAERERLAQERAANKQVEIELAPGVSLTQRNPFETSSVG